jgi:transposase
MDDAQKTKCPSEPSPPQSEPQQTSGDTPSETSPKRRRTRIRRTLSEPQRETILAEYKSCGSIRRVHAATGHDRKTVRAVLEQAGMVIREAAPAQPASKLDRFRETIRDKHTQGLTLTRILREIREEGYGGGRTILNDYARTLPSPRPAPKGVKRRFETEPGAEMQVDWSVYKVLIAGVLCCVHALGCVLAYSRYLHLRFYRDERQSTLLEGLARAFDAFGGTALRLVFDNMATVVLARVGRQRTPLWHPRLLDFARHYGFEPFACRVRHPDRKGKDERIFYYAERDLLRGASFDSLDDLNRRAERWAASVANARVHGTTRRVPAEAFRAERDFLVRLPEARFAVHEDTVRQVGQDATISVAGTPYTVPAHLARRSVAVRLFAEHFEVLDRQGRIAFSRRYVAEVDKGKLQIDPTHYLGLAYGPRSGEDGAGGAPAELQQALLARFPTLAPLLEGITLRMKSLAHVHLRALWRSAQVHGEQPFLAAATRAQDYHRYSALAVERILDKIDPAPAEPPLPLEAATRARVALGEVEQGSLDNYAHLDRDQAATTATQMQAAEPSPENHDKPHTEDDDGQA